MARKRGKQGPGRSKGKGKGKRSEDAEADEPEAKRPRNEDWRDEPWEYKNEQYEAYYRRQGICSEEEFLKMLESLRTGLPVAIRVNRLRLGAASLRERLEELAASSDPEMQCYAPQKLSWYSHGLGWMWPHLERRVIKKDQRHAGLKEYLAQRERAGLISRQEVVSMLPPLFLGVEPHHTVLDLCAAPGSKTFQMLEVMHWPQAEKGPPPTGFILANELQWRRANMLAHQVGRLGSPCMVVVNCDAQFFPEMSSPKPSGGAREIFRFDRVLCDVPCSGDGTLRKTPYIWKSWTPRDGLCLHIRQLNILYRGLELLKVGGRLVYSTCSLNPIEDEAVVAAALRRHCDSVALVAPPESMGGVQAAEGLATWVVPNPEKSGEFFEDFEETPKEVKTGKTKLLSTMYPPTGDFKDQWESVRRHCRRMLPHLMDTGGFFVACFEKRADLAPSAKARREARAARKETEAAEADAEAEEAPKEPEPEKSRASKPEVFRRLTKEYVEVSDILPQWKDVMDFYGIDASLSHRFVMRAEGDKSIFFVSEAVSGLLRQEVKLPTRMVMCGVAAFQRTGAHHERACPWQLAQEGAAQLATSMKRRLSCSRSFLRKLLAERELTIPEVRSAALSGDVQGLEALLEGESLSPGSVALTLIHDGGGQETVPYAVVANVSEGALEFQLRPLEAQSLLEDLAGQPTVQEMLSSKEDPEAKQNDEEEADDKEDE